RLGDLLRSPCDDGHVDVGLGDLKKACQDRIVTTIAVSVVANQQDTASPVSQINPTPAAPPSLAAKRAERFSENRRRMGYGRRSGHRRTSKCASDGLCPGQNPP